MPGPRKLVGRGIAALRQLMAASVVLADSASRLRYLGLKLGRGRPGDAPVALRVRALGGLPIWVRPATSDPHLMIEDFVEDFVALPSELDGVQVERIVELGTNVGVGLAKMAHDHPGARLLGVEADPGNAALARRNLEPWADRCELLEVAVWTSAGQVTVDRSQGRETGFVVLDDGASADTAVKVPARTVEEILEGFAPGEQIDFLYVDIEGTHKRLLSGVDAAWLARVRAIKVSEHDGTDYSAEECARDLQRHGFRTRVIGLQPTGWTVGVRP